VSGKPAAVRISESDEPCRIDRSTHPVGSYAGSSARLRRTTDNERFSTHAGRPARVLNSTRSAPQCERRERRSTTCAVFLGLIPKRYSDRNAKPGNGCVRAASGRLPLSTRHQHHDALDRVSAARLAARCISLVLCQLLYPPPIISPDSVCGLVANRAAFSGVAAEN